MKSHKVVKIIFITIFALVFLASAFFGMYAICGLAGGVRFVVDFDTKYQSVEGFGASSAWYSQFIGSYEGENADEFRQRAVDLLYGDNGLRLEIYRYNIGAGSKELYDKGVGDYRTYDKNTNYSPYTATLGRRLDALTESFFDSSVFSGDYSVFSNPDNYSITGRDEASQKMLAMALNAPLTGRIIMFANSPHYLLTKNGLCLSDNKNENNLKQECFEAFADYAIISAYKLYTGLIVPNSLYFEENSSKIRISPVNEPQHAWSLDTTDQEGCHYDPEYLADFYQVFFERLNFWNRKWNTSFKMDVFESGSYKDSNKNDSLNTRTYIQAFEKKEFWQSIDEISMHDYGAENSVSARKSFIRHLDKKDYDKSVAISEYCNMIEGRDLSMTTAILDSQIISRDLTILNATSWSWWLACASENYNSTLVYYDVLKNAQDTQFDDEYKITLPKRYFAVKHYSAFIRPAMRRVKLVSSDPIGLKGLDYCAFVYDDKTEFAVIVFTNSGASQKVKIKGFNFNTIYQYSTTADYDWKEEKLLGTSTVTLPSNSIVTLVVENKIMR